MSKRCGGNIGCKRSKKYVIHIIGFPDDDSTGSYDRGENSPLYCIYLHNRHAGTHQNRVKSPRYTKIKLSYICRNMFGIGFKY